MKIISNFLLPQVVALALFSSAGMAAESAKSQLDRATDGKQHTGATFDGSKEKRGGVDTTVKSSTSTATQTRTQEQAIKEYKESGKTTDAERKAIENYKNSGKSRSGK
ncbi:MAG: hypothetical protein A2151_09840 [Candidatus Muproteobacteria bacterium RBG_16_65_34]|uniref:DUF4148 domain-containing protein n=1 Tax=Candidatus Muproteobacteria bacterium RBG_16_65_34 TaxID=1817760 RepID=A0A1F6TU41_9PROT|nr:MAG: hypothetical protein A2151_09840 [Candidatus Muproteobacteria bacterium RBG_16_65_34]